jgi:predicted dinucleotide-binding enzyme
MRIGILGSGNVAQALGRGFVAEGHEVKLGSRDPRKLAPWINECGGNASGGSFEEAAQFGELVVLAVHGVAVLEAIAAAGIGNFKGKVIIDTTNPLEKSAGGPPKLVGGLGSSGGENIQRTLHESFVVKAFSTVGNTHFYKPNFVGGPPDMFICGDDKKAKEQVSRICKDFAWEPVDVGGIDVSHYLEATAMVWIITAIKGDWNQAFKFLRNPTAVVHGEANTQ